MMTTNDDTATNPHEATPLLLQEPTTAKKYDKSVLYRALLCSFAVSSSFGVTQVPLIYVFRLMTCDAYYATHSSPETNSLDRCSNHEIEASTARSVAVLGASTTVFGILNLFVTGWAIKKFGISAGLLISVFWPAVRLAIQNVGVMVGGYEGIIIIQASQIITILGGPAGYILALNSYVAEVIDPSERTAALGKLQGFAFLGIASSYFAGGLIMDKFGNIAPFRVTMIMFLLSCLYVLLFLPWLPADKSIAVETSTGGKKFFGPLRIFTPQKWRLPNDRAQTEYGIILLGIGVFLGVLATGYIPVLLQMYATDVYGFRPTENGYLISVNCFARGIFLTMIFPRIISSGRKWYSNRKTSKDVDTIGSSPRRDSVIPDLPNEPNDFAGIGPMEGDEEPIEPPKLNEEQETFAFDLLYTRQSLLADAILTGAASFVNQGWQLYIVAALLPLASGTGAAAKGTILQMCSASERADALSAITLVESAASLATTSIFGIIFSVFANIGKQHLVFTCNAAVALLGFGVLLFSKFPPDGSKRSKDEVNDVEV